MNSSPAVFSVLGGLSLFIFGMLFLGMSVMSNAIAPHSVRPSNSPFA